MAIVLVGLGILVLYHVAIVMLKVLKKEKAFVKWVNKD